MKQKNGWLFKKWNHFKCGAIYGHKYKQIAEIYGFGWFLCKCINCGKTKVF